MSSSKPEIPAPEPLPNPPQPASVPSDHVRIGKPVPAIQLIRLFSPDDWEEFVLEWADSLRSEYETVERCGGAGDMGRDVIATCKDGSGQWDNYQCKRYAAPLMPSDVWSEFGKLLYYTHVGAYSCPRRYVFVAPQGAGNSLSRLIRKPEKLRQEIIKHWDKDCRDEITSKSSIKLEGDLKAHVESFDYSIFEAIPPLRLIDAHQTTRWHVARFGGGLPSRPAVPKPPDDPTETEVVYVSQLFAAYSDHLNQTVETVSDLSGHTDLRDHYGESRRDFYSAESLRTFSRDTLPPGAFESLQDSIHSGVMDDVRDDHSDGYRRLRAVVKTARLLQITDHALIDRLSTLDRGGICHQLANDQKVWWTR